LDLLNQGSVRRAIRDIRPQLIVNAAAYTAVDAAENDESKLTPSTRKPLLSSLTKQSARRTGGALLDGLRFLTARSDRPTTRQMKQSTQRLRQE